MTIYLLLFSTEVLTNMPMKIGICLQRGWAVCAKYTLRAVKVKRSLFVSDCRFATKAVRLVQPHLLLHIPKNVLWLFRGCVRDRLVNCRGQNEKHRRDFPAVLGIPATAPFFSCSWAFLTLLGERLTGKPVMSQGASFERKHSTSFRLWRLHTPNCLWGWLVGS